MKLYHIDRSCLIQEGQVLSLKNNFSSLNPASQKCIELTQSFFADGLSQHGIEYFFFFFLNNNVMSLSNVMEIVFEYERLLNYKDKLSRYQAFYAFDKEGAIEFINQNNLNNTFYKIYEVESDYYEPHNMTLISGNTHYNISAMAKCYWENLEDPFNRKHLTEYLLKFPIRIKKEVKIEDLQ